MRYKHSRFSFFKMAESLRKKLPIWDYFTLGEDTKFAVSKSCNKAISCGGSSTKVYTTIYLVNHLKSVHHDIHEEYQVKYQRQQEKERANKHVSKHLSLEEVQEKVRIWDINDTQSQRIHILVVEMIALDNQPFSVVEDPGFI